MNLKHLTRLRGTTVAAISTLLLLGSGSVALAGGPSSSPAATSNAAVEPVSAADAAEAGTPAAEGTEALGAEADGPGGHADAATGDVNYDFQGEQ